MAEKSRAQSLKHARKRGDFHLWLRWRSEARATHGAPPGTIEDFSWSFRSRRLAFMCILCIYYGWTTRNRATKPEEASAFCFGPRSSFHVPLPLSWLINWHRDARPRRPWWSRLPLTKRRFPPMVGRPRGTPRSRPRGENKLILVRKVPGRVFFRNRRVRFNWLIRLFCFWSCSQLVRDRATISYEICLTRE